MYARSVIFKFDESLTYTDSTQLDFQRAGRTKRLAVSLADERATLDPRWRLINLFHTFDAFF